LKDLEIKVEVVVVVDQREVVINLEVDLVDHTEEEEEEEV
jgi:hypothetical protein